MCAYLFRNNNLHKNSQAVKKGAAYAKKDRMKKSCEIKGGGLKVAVMVG